MTARLVVLASGSGTNLAAILAACASGTLNARVVGVASDNANSGALHRVRDTPTAVLERASFESRVDFDRALAATVAAWAPDLVVLAGFMRLLGRQFLDNFPGRVINLHPALPGELPGLRAIERAYNESRTAGRTTTGIMVHFVPDEGVDNGPVIASTQVPILPEDTLETLTARLRLVEHQLLVESIGRVVAEFNQNTPIYSGEQS